MKSEKRQVVIIGAGPSGSIAASLLKQKGLDIVVIEKEVFPRFSIGESLLPACMELIELAGMEDAVAAAGFQYKDGAAFRLGNQYQEFNFEDKFTEGPGTTFQVQRANFDKVLADEAQKQGVEIRFLHELQSIEVLDECSILSVTNELGEMYQIDADFVLDASGFGRVLPKLLALETPSGLPPRQAIFTHIEDNIDSSLNKPYYDRNKILVTVHPDNRDVWYWLIPFANGCCSLGVVGEPEIFERYGDDNLSVLKKMVGEAPELAELLSNAAFVNDANAIVGYSANVSTLATKRFALLGNAGEFLDPVFSSGVTIAMKSAKLAADCVEKQCLGHIVDWDMEYSNPLKIGVDAFRTYVDGWYSGKLQHVIFYENANPRIKQMICAILAGYAWDTNNPYVKESDKRLNTLAEICSD
ncbi:NAD(P)/FAD-dependent oxidoreductase [Vibrio algarum]|uniref:NAD(P)/FAD-dependent oxidoreductase n=1 Tax=Vibrio algarum TaxID=3020714 RepID=A0ABT4YQG0_9VIBR|nr:NAD(P)/FAD-dependent oxidoreductase [Vibrio sp. KJ40-1]MDB1123269.1 NAD(P)/FAD-dependent oxidoreductase [Vibrio sp. KJ40-1]